MFKDISSVWSGWVTPGRMLSRVYKNLGKKTNRSRYYVKYRDVISERDIGQLVFALQGKWMGNDCQYIFKFKELLAIVCNLSPSSGLTLFRIILRFKRNYSLETLEPCFQILPPPPPRGLPTAPRFSLPGREILRLHDI